MQKYMGHGDTVCRTDRAGTTGSNGEFYWAGAAGGNTLGSRTMGTGAPSKAFGYMFDGDGLAEDPDAFEKLGRLGRAMITNAGVIGPKGQPAILTYFGQFIDHDITRNTDSNPGNLDDFSVARDDGKLTKNTRDAVLATIKNGRVASLRLDSLYGETPAMQACLRNGRKMKIGKTSADRPFDIPRLADQDAACGIAGDAKEPLVGDPRNDENLVVAQLHLAFLRFHNAIVDRLDPGLNNEAAFAKAQRLTTLTYQWLVLNHFVRPLCDPDVVTQVLANPVAEHYTRFSGGAQVMPLEFSVAAFRFGHSMIRPGYRFNANFPQSSLAQLFQFTGRGGMAGGSRLPDSWVIDWNNFLPDDNAALIARGIDGQIAPGLDRLLVDPGLPPNVRAAMEHLPVRNLRRSYVLAIPTAQQVLRAMGGQANMEPLTQAELSGFAGGIIATEGYLDQTPLWLYILLEAEVRTGRQRLGKLGSHIVAETLIGLLAEDPESVLYAGQGGGGWSPADEPVFTKPMNGLADMLRFAGVF